MDYSILINQLERNKTLFYQLFKDASEEETHWKPSEDKWCLLEIVCHLYDEEREDFRVRTRSTLETPNQPLPMFDPVAWVTERKYIEQDYQQMLAKFLAERTTSINWLRSLKNPNWQNAFQHPKLGPLTAHHFLSNWLAHDYLHIRQATKLKYAYLKELTENDLSYAGNWVL